jgi:hypothetical protein
MAPCQVNYITFALNRFLSGISLIYDWIISLELFRIDKFLQEIQKGEETCMQKIASLPC